MSRGADAHDPRSALDEIARAALAAVDAQAATARALDRPALREALAGAGRLVVIAMGKAAAAMARAVLERSDLPPVSGVVITKDEHARGFDLGPFEVIETAHPVPDARSATAGARALEVAGEAEQRDHLLVLLSGGASSLVSLPPEGVELADLASLNAALIGSGAPIDELNAVRKHLSRISGGRLAQAAGCERVSVLAISDVPGDDPAVIGSGPCSPDPSTFEDALDVLERRLESNRVPDSVRRFLEEGASGNHPETAKPGDPTMAGVEYAIVARNLDARGAAADAALRLGAEAIDLGERLCGEARELGRSIGVLARGARSPVPVVLIAGGETVVTLRGRGRGGRNQELALASAIALEGGDTTMLALGSDGTDGPTDAAGAFADGATASRARDAGLDPATHLDGNDAYPLFDALGDLLRTGPTGTNVMDLLFVWIPGAQGASRAAR